MRGVRDLGHPERASEHTFEDRRGKEGKDGLDLLRGLELGPLLV